MYWEVEQLIEHSVSFILFHLYVFVLSYITGTAEYCNVAYAAMWQKRILEYYPANGIMHTFTHTSCCVNYAGLECLTLSASCQS